MRTKQIARMAWAAVLLCQLPAAALAATITVNSLADLSGDDARVYRHPSPEALQ